MQTTDEMRELMLASIRRGLVRLSEAPAVVAGGGKQGFDGQIPDALQNDDRFSAGLDALAAEFDCEITVDGIELSVRKDTIAAPLK